MRENDLVYQSTRDEKNRVTASQAILQGLATDGGALYLLPIRRSDLDLLLQRRFYQEVSRKLVLSAFLDDFSLKQSYHCINHAYDSKFDDAAIAPLVKLDGQYKNFSSTERPLPSRIWLAPIRPSFDDNCSQHGLKKLLF